SEFAGLRSRLWLALRRRGKEFVPLDTCSHTSPAVVRVHAQDASVAPDMNVTRERNLLRQSENELDRTPGLKARFDQKIQTAKADVSRFARFFGDAVFRRESHLQRQHHRETSGSPSFHTICHEPSASPQ